MKKRNRVLALLLAAGLTVGLCGCGNSAASPTSLSSFPAAEPTPELPPAPASEPALEPSPTLEPVSNPTPTPIPMSTQDTDFIIEDGVLVKYIGPGGMVVIPNGVTSIGSDAFGFCESLTSVTIPDSVTSIGDSAFFLCKSLTSITIPNSVTSIGMGAFSSCPSVQECYLDPGNQYYVSKDGVIFTKDMKTLVYYPAGKGGNYVIPNGVTHIGSYAFQPCGGLTNIAIPDSVTSIGIFAFQGCDSLTSINIPGSVISIGVNAFAYCYKLTDVFYSGTEEQWAAINIDNYSLDWDFKSVTTHFNS